MASPEVPPRPARSQNQAPSAGGLNAPQVPPRPSGRRADKSVSPSRDSFARSPLNDSPFPTIPQVSNNENHASNAEIAPPPRPPSVSLPSIGQEGIEYADIHYEEAIDDSAGGAEQTRTVGLDLPLHAPKPSLSKSDAKARISTVTRTDSSQAAAIGIGKSSARDDKDPHTQPLKSKSSSVSIERPGSGASNERPGSGASTYGRPGSGAGMYERPGSGAGMHEMEMGIPEIGQQVPMYPHAGDVQAPSPSPYAQIHPIGIGFHNDGTKPRHHGRTRSGREVFHGPPGSYGLHSHGVNATDKFEKAWYEKHPEVLLQDERGQYSPAIAHGRAEYVLSSEDLNKLVRESAHVGSGLGKTNYCVAIISVVLM